MPSRRLIDGDYKVLIDRILGGTTPTLMVLERDFEWRIRGLTADHHSFLTKEVIEARKPLSPSAKRANWVGCNIRLDLIASDAKLQVVSHGQAIHPSSVRATFQRFNILDQIEPSSRGWTTLTLTLIRGLRSQRFSLQDLYGK
jgi:type II restriction enzyme